MFLAKVPHQMQFETASERAPRALADTHMTEAPATTPPKPPLLRGRTVSECGKPPPVCRGKLVRCPKKVGAGPAQTVAFKATSWAKPQATSKHFACGIVQPHAGSVGSWFQQIMDGEALEPTEFHEFAVNTLLKSKHCRRS